MSGTKRQQYAIISDVHGNVEAFTTVLTYLEGLAVERIYCLGDLVGYGQGARECVDLARTRQIVCLQGNHDAQVRPPRDPRMRPEAAAALDIAATQLDQATLGWLETLPRELVVDNLLVLVHGALTGRDDYILTQEALSENMKLLATKYFGLRAGFFGHTHLPLVAGAGKVRTRFAESDVVSLDPDRQYLINPGSVGQPRDGVPMASFAVYDPTESTVAIIRVEYDIAAEQERMRAAGLPDKLWKRLAVGK